MAAANRFGSLEEVINYKLSLGLSAEDIRRDIETVQAAVDAEQDTRIAEIEAIQTDLTNTQNDLSAAQQDIIAAQADIVSAQADIVQAQSDIIAAQADADQAISDLQTEAATRAADDAFHGGYYYMSANQAVGDSTFSFLEFDANTNRHSTWPTGTTQDGVTLADWIEVPSGSDGGYSITANIRSDGTVDSNRRNISIRLLRTGQSGTGESIGAMDVPNVSGGSWSGTVTAEIDLYAGDKVGCGVIQSSGGTIDYIGSTTTEERCHMSVVRRGKISV